MSAAPLLTVRDLSVSLATRDGMRQIVDGVSLDVARGEVVGVVGESGSGKSVSMLAIMGLLDPARSRVSGSVRFDGVELTELDAEAMRRMRGARLSLVLQNAMTSLNPVYPVGAQIAEQILAHEDVGMAEAMTRAHDLLKLVRIPAPDKRMKAFPHELSGGTRQRVMIAMALSCEPDLVIADEPTTALDVTTQAEVLALLTDLCLARGAGVILVTHDLGIVAQTCDRVAVMYAGRQVEVAGTERLFAAPQHPYTWGLLASIPKATGAPARLRAIPGTPTSLREGTECGFRDRCPHAFGTCALQPALLPRSQAGHLDACHLSQPQREAARADLFERPAAGVGS